MAVNTSLLRSLNLSVLDVPFDASSLPLGNLTDKITFSLMVLSNIKNYSSLQLSFLQELTGIDQVILEGFKEGIVINNTDINQTLLRLGSLFTDPLGQKAQFLIGGTNRTILYDLFIPLQRIVVSNIPTEVFSCLALDKKIIETYIRSLLEVYPEQIVDQIKSLPPNKITALTSNLYNLNNIEAHLKSVVLATVGQQLTPPPSEVIIPITPPSPSGYTCLTDGYDTFVTLSQTCDIISFKYPSDLLSSTSYLVSVSDRGHVVFAQDKKLSGQNVVVMLPTAESVGNGFYVTFRTEDSVTMTITPNAIDTILITGQTLAQGVSLPVPSGASLVIIALVDTTKPTGSPQYWQVLYLQSVMPENVVDDFDVPWSSVLAAQSMTNISMGSFSTSFLWSDSIQNDAFVLSDSVNNTGTGYLLSVSTSSGSSAIPFSIEQESDILFRVNSSGLIGIGTDSLDSILSINGLSDEPLLIVESNNVFQSQPLQTWLDFIGNNSLAVALDGTIQLFNTQRGSLFSISNPKSDEVSIYLGSTGSSPSKLVSVRIRFQDGTEAILANRVF